MNRREFLEMGAITSLYSLLVAEGIIALSANARLDKRPPAIVPDHEKQFNKIMSFIESNEYLKNFFRLEITSWPDLILALDKISNDEKPYRLLVSNILPHAYPEKKEWGISRFDNMHDAIDIARDYQLSYQNLSIQVGVGFTSPLDESRLQDYSDIERSALEYVKSPTNLSSGLTGESAITKSNRLVFSMYDTIFMFPNQPEETEFLSEWGMPNCKIGFYDIHELVAEISLSTDLAISYINVDREIYKIDSLPDWAIKLSEEVAVARNEVRNSIANDYIK